MDTRTMLIIYAVLTGVIFVLILAAAGKNRDYYSRLDKKEHPLRFLYPVAALIYTAYRKIFRKGPNRRLIAKLKRLYVKENVAEEAFLFMVKKIASSLAILFAVCILGTMLCIAGQKSSYVDSLERNEYGKGDAVYDLDVMYEGHEETVQLSLAEQKFTKEEILKKFDASADAVRSLMLGENRSAETVTKPLNLVNEYEGISIAWEIEDTEVIDYNGSLSETLEAGEKALLNLYATFSMEDVTETFTMPVVVAAAPAGETQQLVKKIREQIENGSSIYEKTVRLPEKVNGRTVLFSRIKEHNEYVFLLLGIIAVFLILFGYDKRIDKQIEKRNEQMLLDFSEIVSKLSLLYEAGSSIYMAWTRIVEDYEKAGFKEEHFAYREMKMALEKIRNGMSEKEAYSQFGKRCGLHPYIKLGNILEQNLSKGAKGMKLLLKQEVNDSFEERKRIAKKRGEEAGTKMLVPMVLMLLVVIVIIAVPALMAMRS